MMRIMEADLLKLTQWLSPAFTLGSFAYSHGLETAIAEGQVADAGSLTAWLEPVLLHGTGPLDGARLLAARRGEAQAANWAEARAGSKER